MVSRTGSENTIKRESLQNLKNPANSPRLTPIGQKRIKIQVHTWWVDKFRQIRYKHEFATAKRHDNPVNSHNPDKSIKDCQRFSQSMTTQGLSMKKANLILELTSSGIDRGYINLHTRAYLLCPATRPGNQLPREYVNRQSQCTLNHVSSNAPIKSCTVENREYILTVKPLRWLTQ